MMKRSAMVGLALALAAGQVQAQTTVIPIGTYTGGSSFATSLTGGMTYLNGILTLTISNNGPGVFAAIGIINAPSTGITGGAAPTGWTWNTTSQLGGAGLPNTTWAWIAPSPAPQNGVQPGQGPLTFTFNIGSAAYSNIGFAVHAISGPNGCSTKFGIWRNSAGNITTNDATNGGQTIDPTCVAVPEPESMALLVTGLAGLAFVAVRRRNGLELVDEAGNAI